MKKTILFILLIICINISAQNWTFKSGGSAFDGKYKTSSIKGKGTDFPYNNPLLVINLFNEESLNFYIADAGYFPESAETEVLWIFDNEPNTLYKSNNLSTSKDNKIIFFEDFQSSASNESLSKIEFIEKIKTAKKLNIRIKNNYGQNDLVFSLRGSTKAINYVISKSYREKLIAYQNEIKRIAKEKLDEQIKVSTRIYKMLNNSGIGTNEWKELFEKIEYNCKLYDISLKEVDTININLKKYSTNLILIDKNGSQLKEIKYVDSVIPEYIKKVKKEKLNSTKNTVKPLISHLKLVENEETKVIERIIYITERENINLSDLDSINIIVSPKSYLDSSIELFDNQKKYYKKTISIPSYRKRKLELVKKNSEIRIDSLLNNYNLTKSEKEMIITRITEEQLQEIELNNANKLEFEILSYITYFKFSNNEKEIEKVAIFNKELIKKIKKEKKKLKKKRN